MAREQELIEAKRYMMAILDPLSWVDLYKPMLAGNQFTLVGHEYQADWFLENARKQCFIKGAQIGATETLVLKTLHGMIHEKYPAGALYLFPTRDDVRDFSKTRFDPLISENDFIGMHVKDTDSQNIKKIGKGHLYLRGTRSTSQLKSIPVDRIVFDEIDEIDPRMVELAEERVSHSSVKEQVYLGTPTIPDYGADFYYKQSDQRVWMVRCDACSKAYSLDLEFPNCLRRLDTGKVIRICVNCEKQVNPRNGFWDAQYPMKSQDLVGWWISQLNSTYIDPTRILNLYEDPPYGDLSEVMNSKLGRAYIDAENRLTENQVFGCCGPDPMLTKHGGPTCMGVDVGKVLNVVIAEKVSKSVLKIIKVGRVDDFSDLHDLARDFNVRSTVIDLFPEQRKVREFQKQEHHLVMGCNYVETRTGQTVWDESDGVIKCNRTEICDASHDLVATPGRLIIPRINEEMKEFAKQVCGIAKVLEEDRDTGAKTYRYRKVHIHDHYRHALNYCMLASERCGSVSDRNLIGRFFRRRLRKTPWTA